jgi:hypothetical protein
VDAVVLRYRGREIGPSEVAFVRELVAAHPQASRRALSAELSRAWGWVQPNGQLRDMLCRSLMLALARAGHIELPPVRRRPPNPLARRARPAPVALDRTLVRGNLGDLGRLDFRQVRRTEEEALFNSLIEQHHYLGYTQPVGEHLKYLVVAGGRAVACFAWSSAPRHLGPRDRYIGWSPQARRRNIHLVAYNPRFLILPWVAVRHLASHLLGQMMRRLSADWEKLYGHPIHFAETFVEPALYRGTCYRAANWIVLGRTTGRGKDDLTHRPNRTVKEVLGYPLIGHFRELLGAGAGR